MRTSMIPNLVRPSRSRVLYLLLLVAVFVLSMALFIPRAHASDLLVSSLYNNSVDRYDGTTGAFLGTFIPSGSGGLSGPAEMTFGPDGNLYVCSNHTNSILRYDGTTGAFIDAFVPSGSGGLIKPYYGLRFGPDKNLYVVSWDSYLGSPNRVLKYDGTTGAFLGAFNPSDSGGMNPYTMIFGPDGNLYSLDLVTHNITRFDGKTGAFLGIFASCNGHVIAPETLTFGPDGNLYVAGRGTNNVARFNGETGAFLDEFVPPGNLACPDFMIFGSDGNLYICNDGVSGGAPGDPTSNVQRFSGTTGAFIGTFVLAGSGGLNDPAALVFFPQGAPVTIAITSPTNTIYILNQAIAASYSCTGSGVATCVGPVPCGSNIDTASVGTKTFTVTAKDISSNVLATKSVTYTIAYSVGLLYDPTKAVKSGATIPIKIQLNDANGNDVSSSSIVVHATGVIRVSNNAPGVLEDAGNANPDNDFRFDATLGSAGGYIFNLQTTGYTTGTYNQNFTAGNDPTTHTVQFQVK